jgi:hypothetical protein
MNDSYTRPHTTRDGKRIGGASAREERIKAEGGVDRIKDKAYMRGFVDGYGACQQDNAERMDAVEARVTELEGSRNRV